MTTRPDRERVAVTGLGLVTPLGENRETSWSRLTSGDSAVGAEGARVPLPDVRHRALAWAERAAAEALAEVGDAWTGGERCGCSVSGSKPLLSEFSRDALDWRPPEDVCSMVARLGRAGGPVINLSSACATGAQSVLVAAGWIREGRVDRALAGAAESSFHPLYVAGFDQMGVLSPGRRVRPFDRARDGFLLGEGAGVFVLERWDLARARGAAIYAEVSGGDFSCDAHHATRFNSQGRRMADCLRRALTRAGATPADLDYVNAHGTATLLNDALETRALESLFQEGGAPPVSSTKGATGHLLGATGAVELGFTLLALRDGRLPPTLNLENPETESIDFIPGRSRPAIVRRAASLSFGFGGALASVVLEKPECAPL